MVGLNMEYGCIGERLSHSFSKIIHNEICDYNYELREIAPDGLDGFLRKADFKAINVTIPYKQAVIPYLDELDEKAEEIGAVNTIVNRGGRLYGYNTDFSGLRALIKYKGIDLNGKKVLVLGSGGTSKTAYSVAIDLNAAEVFRVSRSGGESLITYEQAVRDHSDADVIINTTPCGMFPSIGEQALDISGFKRLSGVVDAVYNPLKSALVVSAEQRGIAAVGGLYMLVSQAIFAAELFTDSKIDASAAERIYRSLLLEKRNMVLIGMPGCGKSTIGRLAAERLGKSFYDIDEEIVKREGMSVSEIFELYGEEKFREAESAVAAELALKQGCVIATGGGTVLNKENTRLLRENGIIIFIDRPLEQLAATADRPLSSNREMLEKRYAERYELYRASADVSVSADGDLNSNFKKVKEAFLNENSCN